MAGPLVFCLALGGFLLLVSVTSESFTESVYTSKSSRLCGNSYQLVYITMHTFTQAYTDFLLLLLPLLRPHICIVI